VGGEKVDFSKGGGIEKKKDRGFTITVEKNGIIGGGTEKEKSGAHQPLIRRERTDQNLLGDMEGPHESLSWGARNGRAKRL